MTSLQDKVAVVTGASQGIGKEIAIKLASEGAKIVLVARNQEKITEVANEISNHNGIAFTFRTDVADESKVSQMVEEAVRKFGKVDILVNNAGGAGPTKAIQDLSLAEWSDVVDSNLTGSFLCTKYVVPLMIKENYGRIINISSASAKTGLSYRSGYCAAKAAIIGFTRSLALELGPNNICVNTIIPGAVSGERIDHVIEEQAKQRGITVEEYREKILFTKYPLKRLVEPQDIANLVAFLAGDSGANITGEDINVTAGGYIG